MRAVVGFSLLALLVTSGVASCGTTPPPGGGGGGGTGGSAGTGGTSPLPDRCTLPAEPGPCLAAFTAYYHDVRTGLCTPFIWGGCDNNDANRFNTMAECQAACNGGTPNMDACQQPYECSLAPNGCCGDCGDGTAQSFVALNRAQLGNYERARGCSGVACGPCPPIDVLQRTSPYFAATCAAGSCRVVDTRQTDVTACTTDSDCTLRLGLNCCESCGGDNLLAVNKRADLNALLCGDGAGACPPCVPVYPDEFRPACDSGRCLVVRVAP